MQTSNVNCVQPFHASYPKEWTPAPATGRFAFAKNSYGAVARAASSAMNAMVNAMGIRRLILPAVESQWANKQTGQIDEQSKQVRQINRIIAQRKHQERYDPCSELNIRTADGIKIGGTIIWADLSDYEKFVESPNSDEAFTNKKWTVCCLGNMMSSDDNLVNMQDRYFNPKSYSQATGRNVISFDYRGVGLSGGPDLESDKALAPKSAKDLILDGDAVVQFLLSKGVRSEDILIEGFSLGGGVGAQVRALHPEGPIANVRSFGSISQLVGETVRSLILNTYDHEKGVLTKEALPSYRPSLIRRALAGPVSAVVGGIAGGILRASGWELDTVSVWPKIKGQKEIISSKNDEVMLGGGKLYTVLKRLLPCYHKDSPYKEEIKKELNHIKETKYTRGHGKHISDEAWDQHLAYVRSC